MTSPSMTPAQRQAAFRQRRDARLVRYRNALEIISVDPPNHPWAKMAAQVAKQALSPKPEAKEQE